MTLQQMEYVLAVDRFRHFARAAAHCRVTQPTLSAMIQKLEDELDAPIFDRSHQPVRPTAIGARIIEQARLALAQADGIRQIVAEEKHSLTGLFRLGILPTIAPYLIPRFFPQLRRQHPQLDIRVTEMKTEQVKAALHSGEVDAGIVAALPGMDGFVRNLLFYEPFLAYVSRGSELFGHDIIRTSDLANAQLWLLDEGHCLRDQMVKFCQLKSVRANQEVYRLGSMETFMRMVEGGEGVTFIPGLAVDQLSESQRELVRPFAIPRPARQIVMLTDRLFIRHTLLQAVAEEIRASVPAEMLVLQPSQVAI